MNSTRLGCLTAPGLLAAGLTLVIVVTITLLRGGVLFSPGALNAQAGEPLNGYTSHAEFGNRCRLCHAPFWDAAGMSGRCQACHTSIAVERSDPATLHGALFQQSPQSACRDCHPDHRGPEAPLTELNGGQFPHEKLGFSLQGHAFRQNDQPFVCQDCHNPGFPPFDQAICQTCHQQMDTTFTTAHVLSFGGDCLACHDGIDTYGDDFDHNRFVFQLTGRHADVPCSSCHLDARAIADLRAAPVDCASCHADDDPHEGRFGTDCAACHNTTSWEDASFDHNLTQFPLTGAHVGLPCTSCHVNDTFSGLSTACASCHAEPAFHAGLFAGMSCDSCHTTAAWRPAAFNWPHTFPLNHGGGTSCATCHPNTLTAYTCYGCHEHHPDEIRNKHLKEGITNFDNCIACHPTGQEHEGNGDDD